jgi:hypothetical protein
MNFEKPEKCPLCNASLASHVAIIAGICPICKENMSCLPQNKGE